MSDGSPASIEVHRTLEWVDTDAAGIWHWTAAFRHLEAAERALHAALGIDGLTFGWSPRVKVDVDFRAPVSFGEVVTTALHVERIGSSSITYALELRVGERVVVTGRLVTVIVDDDGVPVVVPEDIRSPLLTAGTVLPSTS